MRLRRPVLLFDSRCPLCRAQVRWLVERDRAERLRFATLQSPIGRRILREHGLRVRDDGTRAALVEGEHLRLNSDSFLRSCAYLDSRWRRLSALQAVPRFLRESIYRRLARMGQASAGAERGERRMWKPPPQLRRRFIGAPYANDRRHGSEGNPRARNRY